MCSQLNSTLRSHSRHPKSRTKSKFWRLKSFNSFFAKKFNFFFWTGNNIWNEITKSRLNKATQAILPIYKALWFRDMPHTCLIVIDFTSISPMSCPNWRAISENNWNNRSGMAGWQGQASLYLALLTCWMKRKREREGAPDVCD